MKKLIFGVEVSMPCEEWIGQPVTDNQADTIETNREWKSVAPAVWPSVCQAILKEAGCPGKLDKYRASVILGFLKSAAMPQYHRAENAGFSDFGGQETLL